MGDYLDIIVFAVIAVGLLLRLRSVLGDRNDSDVPLTAQRIKDIDGTAIRKGDAPAVNFTDHGQERWAQNPPDFNFVENATAHNHLSQFLAVDPSFRPADFLDKAKKAFGLILAAYSGGNRNTLGFLLTPEMLAGFNRTLDAREAAKETYFTQLQGISKAVITDAALDGTHARVTVEFVAEQSITHKDSEGRIIDNNEGHRRTTKDRWVFVKDLKDANPTWLLAEILAHQD